MEDEAETPNPDGAPLSPHRLVLRMASAGIAGGLAFGLTMFLVARGADFGLFVAAAASGIVACALLVSAEQAARRVRPTRRPLVLVLVALGASLVVAVACAWAIGVFVGGAESGYAYVAGLIAAISRDTSESVGVAVSGLVPFVVVGMLRGSSPWRDTPCRLWTQAVGGAFGGLGAIAVFSVAVERVGFRELWIVLFFVLPVAVAPLAMAAGEALELRLVARWQDR